MIESGLRQRILIVDDEPANISILAKALRTGYDISVATNGPDALKIAATDPPPDLVLLDVVMGGMDGYEVCRLLKSNEATHDIPVIFVTTQGKEQDETRGLELGAVDYITKPFSLPIVKARVQTHLDLKAKTDLLKQISALDGLTGVANRRRFDQVLECEWNRGVRSQTWLSIVMADVDFFKAFNDGYGHIAGDECLRAVARTLISGLRRPADLLARYGGEEFAAILPDTGLEGARHLAETMRKSVQSLSIPHEGSSISDFLTVSLGAASIIPRKDVLPRVLMEFADKMLYKAKTGGRNQVACICCPNCPVDTPCGCSI